MEDLTKKKTYVADVERTLYDIRDEDRSSYKTAKGLTEDIVRDISAKKEEPEWMLQKRLEALRIYHQMPMPTWGPDISALHMDDIVTYVRPDTK